MIEYKAVAMDLDDTLLTSDLQISEETKQTLLQCQKDGMHVILASGRPIYAIEKRVGTGEIWRLYCGL